MNQAANTSNADIITIEIAGYSVVCEYDGNVYANFVSARGNAVEFDSHGNTALETYLAALMWVTAHEIVTSSGLNVLEIDGLTDEDDGFDELHSEVVDAQRHLLWDDSQLAATEEQLSKRNYGLETDYAQIDNESYVTALAQMRADAIEELTDAINDNDDVQEFLAEVEAAQDYDYEAQDEDDEDEDPPRRPSELHRWVLAIDVRDSELVRYSLRTNETRDNDWL